MNIQVITISVIAVLFVSVDRTQAGVSRAQMESLAKGFRTTCVRKVKANMTLVEGIRNGQFPEGNMALKCYTKCIMVLMKTVAKDHRADLKALEKQIKAMAADNVADRLVQAAVKCYDEIHDDDPCEYTWKYTKCTYDADPEIFFFP